MPQVYPVAAGHPQPSGIYIPEIWSGKLLVKFYDASVLPQISNTDYQGEIKNQGDKVHIRTVPDITIKDHKIGQLLEYELPTGELVTLLVDKGKYYAFISDDVTKAQGDHTYLEKWTTDAADQMKITVDKEVLADIHADAHATNQGVTAGKTSQGFNLGATGAPVTLDKTNITDYIVDAGTVLDEQSVPQDGRWMVLPPWMCGMIKKSDLKDASLAGDQTSMLRNGRIGVIDRFTLYNSNLLSTVSDGGSNVTNAIFGHPSALTFASQLIKNEGPMRDAKFFGDLYRGLQVYGYKVVKSEAMGKLYAKKG